MAIVNTYYSTSGEDAVLYGLIRRAEWLLDTAILSPESPKYYVDIGCSEPVRDSNTFMFYTFNWSGILVDPNTDLISEIKESRPRDIFMNAAVLDYEGESSYYVLGNGHGANTINSKFMDQVVKLPGFELEEVRKVPVITLDMIMEQAPEEIFLLDIDAEGSDYKILSSYSWAKYPTFILIEDLDLNTHSRDARISDILTERGYVLVAGLYVSSIYLLKGTDIHRALYPGVSG